MEIFICWSGPVSKKVAELIYNWLQNMFHVVKPWLSEYDIDKGDHWNDVLDSKLQNSNFGLVCLTPDNLNNPWVLYETGSISKSLKGRTWTLLYRLKPADIKGPLSRFQHTVAEKNDILQLVQSINHILDNESLNEKRLLSQFEKWWPDLESGLDGINNSIIEASTTKPRSDREILEEMLEILRKPSQFGLTDNPAEIQVLVRGNDGTRLIRFAPTMEYLSSESYRSPEAVGRNLTTGLFGKDK